MNAWSDINWQFAVDPFWAFVILLFLALLLFLTVVKRIGQLRWLYFIASLLLVASLFFLIALPKTKIEEIAKPILVQSKNAAIDTLEKLDEEEYFKKLSVLDFDIFLDSLNVLNKSLQSVGISEVHIVGDGLPKESLAKLQGIPVRFTLNAPTAGWITPLSPVNSLEGEEACAEWHWQGDLPDSISVLNNGNEFENYTWLPHEKILRIDLDTDRPGRYLYKVLTRPVEGNNASTALESQFDSVSTSVFGHEVFARTAQEVLVLSGDLDYELPRYRDFLAENGHTVKMRSQLGEGIFHYQNAEKGSTIKELLPQKQGLLILNSAAIRRLSSTETNSIETALKKGLLNIWLAQVEPNDVSAFPEFWRNICRQFQTIGGSAEQQQIALDSGDEKPVKTYPFSFAAGKNNIFLKSKSGRGLAASRYHKGGKVAWSSLKDLHLLALSGKKELLQEVIDEHLNALTHEQGSGLRFHLPTNPVLEKGRKIPVELLQLKPPHDWKIENIKSQKSTAIPFRNAAHMNFYWHSEFRPTETGWHQVWSDKSKGSTFHFYVTDSTSWNELRRRSIIAENQDFAENQSQLKVQATYTVEKPISRVIPFLMVLLSLGILWLVEKRNY